MMKMDKRKRAQEDVEGVKNAGGARKVDEVSTHTFFTHCYCFLTLMATDKSLTSEVISIDQDN